jgi:hypothetical protein
VRLPVWLPLLVAILVLGFGAYRIWLGLRKDPPASGDEPDPATSSRSVFAGGFYRMGKRTHLFIGTIYLVLGAILLATAFGFNPLAALGGSKATDSAQQK